jgi:hypothetical protein
MVSPWCIFGLVDGVSSTACVAFEVCGVCFCWMLELATIAALVHATHARRDVCIEGCTTFEDCISRYVELGQHQLIHARLRS